MSDETTRSRQVLPRAAPRAPRWTLLVLFLNNRIVADTLAILPAGGLVIGRGEGAGLRLAADASVSRRHAALHPVRGGIALQDLDSRNGCWVNGVRVKEAVLRDGDRLRLGDAFLLLRHQRAEPDLPVPELLGRSAVMRRLRTRLGSLAGRSEPILLTGQTGTGKGAAAEALHRLSGRPGELLQVNAAALPVALAESLLFGHVQGAFTGATASPGYLREASGGTLFLDEIGELDPTIQAKLLLAVERGEVIPVGASRAVPIDLRLLCATNRTLRQDAAEGRFRADLLARLATFELALPALSDRREDILVLLDRFLQLRAPLHPDLVSALLERPWPFNVRGVRRAAAELEVQGAHAAVLLPDMLPALPTAASPSTPPAPRPGRDQLAALLSEHGGVVAEVARTLDCSTKQVYRWMKRHDLDPADYRA